jgi:hypothetical protein
MAKMTVEFNGKMNDILDGLAKEKGMSKADVLRRAVALYRYLEDEQKGNRRVSITEKGTEKVVKEIVLP